MYLLNTFPLMRHYNVKCVFHRVGVLSVEIIVHHPDENTYIVKSNRNQTDAKAVQVHRLSLLGCYNCRLGEKQTQ